MVSSDDGLYYEFNDASPAYEKMVKYVDKAIIDKVPNYRGSKFERPQLLLKDGIPTHLYAPAGPNINGGDGSCCYLLRIKPDKE